MTMISNSIKHGILLRCHAFASNANIQHRHNSMIVRSCRLKQKSDFPLVIRGGGSGPFSSSGSTTAGTRLSSAASPLKETSSVCEKEEFEKRVLESLSIASGGPIATPTRSFGGLVYQDTSSTKSSLFRVVFVLGGPGKTLLNEVATRQSFGSC